MSILSKLGDPLFDFFSHFMYCWIKFRDVYYDDYLIIDMIGYFPSFCMVLQKIEKKILQYANWDFNRCSFFFLSGALNEDYLRELLTTLGDRFTQDEVDDLYKEAPIKNGQFDYVEFTRILKHGAKDPDDKWTNLQNMKNNRS